MNKTKEWTQIGYYAEVLDHIYRNADHQVTFDEMRLANLKFTETGIRSLAEKGIIFDVWQDVVTLEPELLAYANHMYSSEPEYLQVDDINKALNIIKEQRRHYNAEKESLSDRKRYKYLDTINSQLKKIIIYIKGSYQYVSEVKIEEYSTAKTYELKTVIYEEVTNDGKDGKDKGHLVLLSDMLDTVKDEIISDPFYLKEVRFEKFVDTIKELVFLYKSSMRSIENLHCKFKEMFSRSRTKQLLREKNDKIYELFCLGEIERKTNIKEIAENINACCFRDDKNTKPWHRSFLWPSLVLFSEEQSYIDAAVEIAKVCPEKNVKKKFFDETTSEDYNSDQRRSVNIFGSCLRSLEKNFQYTEKDLFTYIIEYDFKKYIKNLSDEDLEKVNKEMKIQLFLTLFDILFSEYYQEKKKTISIYDFGRYKEFKCRYPKIYNKRLWTSLM